MDGAQSWLVAVAGGRNLFVPVVVVELALGVLIGPQVLDLARVDAFTEFFADLGLSMLFFFLPPFFLAFFAPPSNERLASTSFSADWSFFFSAVSSFWRALRSLSLNVVPLANLMIPITLPRLKIIVQIKTRE